MNVKEAWLKELRSGKYKQGQGYLKNSFNEFCCLGIGCLVLGEEFTPVPGRSSIQQTKAGEISALFEGKLQRLGISQSVEKKLIDMNDIQRKSFNEIADWIEANVV